MDIAVAELLGFGFLQLNVIKEVSLLSWHPQPFCLFTPGAYLLMQLTLLLDVG
ncbi:MAG: hypothetical protein NPINA01_27650 [Nitrospinaceae bacterium]|nr:MAG: hypothetical protein NPINA01_27650 [Nitrospinaceae bacterium]